MLHQIASCVIFRESKEEWESRKRKEKTDNGRNRKREKR